MFNISSFLNKLSEKISDSNNAVDKILGVIFFYTKISLLKDDIEIKDNKILIKKNSPVLKNLIFIKKSEILKDLRDKTSNNFLDIY